MRETKREEAAALAAAIVPENSAMGACTSNDAAGHFERNEVRFSIARFLCDESAFSEPHAGHSPPPQPFAFNGIHVISPRLLRLRQEEGAFSIIDTYLRLASNGENILAFPADDAYWRDLGRPADLIQAAQDQDNGAFF